MCETDSISIEHVHEKIINNKVLSISFYKWLIKWIYLELIVLIIGLGLFALFACFIARFEEGKAQMALFTLATMIFLFVPNGGMFFVLKDTINTLKLLKKTNLLKCKNECIDELDCCKNDRHEI